MRAQRLLGTTVYKLLWLYRETVSLGEWKKEFQKGKQIVQVQQVYSPGRVKCPNFSAGQPVPAEQVERGCLGKVVAHKKVS